MGNLTDEFHPRLFIHHFMLLSLVLIRPQKLMLCDFSLKKTTDGCYLVGSWSVFKILRSKILESLFMTTGFHNWMHWLSAYKQMAFVDISGQGKVCYSYSQSCLMEPVCAKTCCIRQVHVISMGIPSQARTIKPVSCLCEKAAVLY